MQEPDGRGVDSPDEWLPLAEAARRLNTSVDALRKQVRRGRREARRDNHGQWLVKAVHLDSVRGLDGLRARAGRTRRGVQVDGLAAELSVSRAEVADLRERLAERDRCLDDLQAERDGLRAELVRERNRAEDMRAEAAELRGRLAEATRPGPIARLLEALASRLTRGTDVQRS